MEFYEKIKAAIHDEAEDNEKYAKMAEIAPTEKAKKILTDISQEEERHKEFLQEILADSKSAEGCEGDTESQDENSKEHDAGNKVAAENNQSIV